MNNNDSFEKWLATVAVYWILITFALAVGIPFAHCMLTPTVPGPIAIAIHVANSLMIAAHVLCVAWFVKQAHGLLDMLDAIDKRDKQRAVDANAPAKTIEEHVDDGNLLCRHDDITSIMGYYGVAYVLCAIPIAALVFWAHPLAFWHAGLYALVLMVLGYASFLVADAVTSTTYYAEAEEKKEARRKEDEVVEYVLQRVDRERKRIQRDRIRRELASGKGAYRIANQMEADFLDNDESNKKE